MQRGARLFEPLAIDPVIDRDEQLPGLDALIVLHQHLRHIARHLRRDDRHLAAHIGVLGALHGVGERREPPGVKHQQRTSHGNEREDNGPQQAAARYNRNSVSGWLRRGRRSGRRRRRGRRLRGDVRGRGHIRRQPFGFDAVGTGHEGVGHCLVCHSMDCVAASIAAASAALRCRKMSLAWMIATHSAPASAASAIHWKMSL